MTLFTVFLDVNVDNGETGEEVALQLTKQNNKNVRFEFVQKIDATDNKYPTCEFYVYGTSRKIVDEALTQLGYNRGSEHYSKF